MLSLKTGQYRIALKKTTITCYPKGGGIENKNRSSDFWSLIRSQSDHFTEVKRAEQRKFVSFFLIQVFASDLV